MPKYFFVLVIFILFNISCSEEEYQNFDVETNFEIKNDTNNLQSDSNKNHDMSTTDKYDTINSNDIAIYDSQKDDSIKTSDIVNDNSNDTVIFQDGTKEHPFIIPGNPELPDFIDSKDTNNALSNIFDNYPPNTLNESGPEFIYKVTISEQVSFIAWISVPEPDGVDIDLQLLSSLDPLVLIDRGDYQVSAVLKPGTYYLILDTYSDNGVLMKGKYNLTVSIKSYHLGNMDDPIVIGTTKNVPVSLPYAFNDVRNTKDAISSEFDSYPPNNTNESGPEYIYTFTTDKAIKFSAFIEMPEPSGTDIDVHILSSLNPLKLIERDDKGVYVALDPGTYWLVLDTYTPSSGNPKTGEYALHVTIRDATPSTDALFNDYILDSVDYLYNNYGLLGYDSGVLTHDMPYGKYGVIKKTKGAKTMCVAAVMEIILQAINLYAKDTGDESVFDYLPKSSWENLKASSIKAHIWVNPDLGACGTADALTHFGMGMRLPFKQLIPGSFINLNRTTGTGHAVVFLSFIDINGNEYSSWNEDIVGFKYFSSQGGYDVGKGGLDYRYAVFSKYGSPVMPYKKDTKIIYSEDQCYLNTGIMFAPEYWLKQRVTPPRCYKRNDCPETTFNATYFDGITPE